MLVHIGQPEIASRVQNAWLKTLEEGIHTYDIFKEGVSMERRGTAGFADAVIERLGQAPSLLKPVKFTNALSTLVNRPALRPVAKKELAGVDVFLQASGISPDDLAKTVSRASEHLFLQLQMITNRGTKVWPGGFPETFCTDHWRCRFKPNDGVIGFPYQQVVKLLQQLNVASLDILKTENLYYFDGQPGYTAAQGQ